LPEEREVVGCDSAWHAWRGDPSEWRRTEKEAVDDTEQCTTEKKKKLASGVVAREWLTARPRHEDRLWAAAGQRGPAGEGKKKEIRLAQRNSKIFLFI
jgi:hypothetical protein